MARKVNKDYVNQYGKIVLTQPLAHGKYIQQTYTKEGLTWKVVHSSNSAYHICPYDGQFRNCKDCGALEDDFDVKFCLKKQQLISSTALSGRINDCLKAGLEVKFIDQEDLQVNIFRGKTEIEYAYPIHSGADEEKILYHALKCKKCEKLILSQDAVTDFTYCPYCGRRISHE